MGNEIKDNINPDHYKQGGVECIVALDAAVINKEGPEAFHVANAIKYLWRYEAKNGSEDIKKAQWYLERLLSIVEEREEREEKEKINYPLTKDKCFTIGESKDHISYVTEQDLIGKEKAFSILEGQDKLYRKKNSESEIPFMYEIIGENILTNNIILQRIEDQILIYSHRDKFLEEFEIWKEQENN